MSVALVVLCGGCAGNEQKPVTGAWGAEWEDARKNASSEFEKAVLSDGEITQDEYVEAMDLYVECIEDNGSAVSLHESAGVFSYEIGADIAHYDAVADKCSEGTSGIIEPLYLDSTQNPNKLPWKTVIADCLVARGVANEGFTGNDLDSLRDKAVENDDGSYSDPIADQILGSTEYEECMMNPSFRG